MARRSEKAVDTVREAFERAVASLSDADYLDVLDELVSDFELRAEVKRRELERADAD